MVGVLAPARAGTRLVKPPVYPRVDWKDKVAPIKPALPVHNHDCHWPGCKTRCLPAYWACRAHWFRLPSALRTGLWAYYVPGQEENRAKVTARYLDAARDVENWIRANCRCRACGGQPTGCEACNHSGVQQ